jgi:hypothetical protein
MQNNNLLLRAARVASLALGLMAGHALAQTAAGDTTAMPAATATPAPVAPAALVAPTPPAATVVAQASAQPGAEAPAPAAAAAKPQINGADTAWMLISTVLVLLMTIPGIILFYGGMLRTKNALSIVAHTLAATAVITVL